MLCLLSRNSGRRVTAFTSTDTEEAGCHVRIGQVRRWRLPSPGPAIITLFGIRRHGRRRQLVESDEEMKNTSAVKRRTLRVIMPVQSCDGSSPCLDRCMTTHWSFGRGTAASQRQHLVCVYLYARLERRWDILAFRSRCRPEIFLLLQAYCCW